MKRTGHKSGFAEDRRRFARAPIDLSVAYHTGAGETGTARCSDVGRGGLALHMDRPIEADTHIMLQVNSVPETHEPVELKAKVAWCAPSQEARGFTVGLRTLYDVPDVAAIQDWMIFVGLQQMHERLRKMNWADPQAESRGRAHRQRQRIVALAKVADAASFGVVVAAVAAFMGIN